MRLAIIFVEVRQKCGDRRLPGLWKPGWQSDALGASDLILLFLFALLTFMPADLLNQPRYLAEHLGQPMPDSPHALSACLPLWSHNIGYEEGDPAVIDRLQAAYPRFCLNPLVRQLCDQVFVPLNGMGLIFPSRASAERAVEYCRDQQGSTARLVEIDDQSVVGVAVSADEYNLLKQYWQHAGEVTSSRVAEQILAGQNVSFGDNELQQIVCGRVADLQGADVSHVRLYPSVMAAMAAVWRVVRAIDSSSPSVQFGFPYVDTLKIQQRFRPAKCRFFPVGCDSDIDALEAELAAGSVSAVFCETPTNPLLTCPDLRRLRGLADKFGFLLIVDDTLAACMNLDVLPLADVVVTSLTKYFSGYGDVLAGSVVLNSASLHFEQIRRLLFDRYSCLLADVDLQVLERNSRDVGWRVATINGNAAELARRLAGHPAVAKVFHPSVVTGSHRPDPNYESLRRPDGGYGGLMSIVLRNPAINTPPVFDAMAFCKGPNLGTVFTLCCPYTILAHYTELDFVESCGVSRWLLRLSIGVEPLEELWRRFQTALKLGDDIRRQDLT